MLSREYCGWTSCRNPAKSQVSASSVAPRKSQWPKLRPCFSLILSWFRREGAGQHASPHSVPALLKSTEGPPIGTKAFLCESRADGSKSKERRVDRCDTFLSGMSLSVMDKTVYMEISP